MNKTLAKYLRDQIKKHGFTMVYISKLTSIPYQRLNRIFNANSTMSACELLVMSKAIGLTTDDLYSQMNKVPND